MLIRIGFDIQMDCPAPTPMLLMLGVRPERRASLRRPDDLIVEPFAPVSFFTDSFHASRGGSRSSCSLIMCPR